MDKCRTKGCDNEFIKYSSLQSYCIKCSIERGRAIQAKAERKAHKEAKERIKPRSKWLKEAQAEFNKYIRLRDKDEPCISCGRHHQGQYHAGHYRSVGAHPELRFSLDNVHKQCSSCNNHKSGNIVDYRINLRKKIGPDRLDWLEGPHEPKKYTVDEIKAIKKKYAKMARELS